MTIRLLDLEQPLEPVEFPNGRTFQVRPLDAGGYELMQQVEKSQDYTQALTLLRRLVPDATDADLATLSARMVTGIILHARHQLDAVLDSLKKNGSVAPPKPATPAPPSTARSKRRTRSATSSRESPAPSA